MTDYVNPLNAALYSKLANASALITLLGGTALYYLQAPDDASLPYVVWNYQGGPGYLNETAHDTVNELLFIRGYAATPALAGSIGAAIHNTLHGGSVSASGYANIWSRQERTLSNIEIDAANFKTFMSGGYYRIRLDPT